MDFWLKGIFKSTELGVFATISELGSQSWMVLVAVKKDVEVKHV
jgi:hypothetical protein